jgi:hypothetical protein
MRLADHSRLHDMIESRHLGMQHTGTTVLFGAGRAHRSIALSSGGVVKLFGYLTSIIKKVSTYLYRLT